jgi:hypothetical protein
MYVIKDLKCTTFSVKKIIRYSGRGGVDRFLRNNQRNRKLPKKRGFVKTTVQYI